jgi:hypothetical protein
VWFDPQHGFDAEAMAAITEPMAPSADAKAVLEQLANALRVRLKSRPKPTKRERERHIKERDRLTKRLRQIDALAVDLRADDSGANWLAVKALEQVKAESITLLTLHAAWVHLHKRGADPDLDVFFGEVLRIAVDVGIPLTISPASRGGGRLARFMTAVMLSIDQDPPTIDTLREIVDRWYPARRGRGKKRRR